MMALCIQKSGVRLVEERELSLETQYETYIHTLERCH